MTPLESVCADLSIAYARLRAAELVREDVLDALQALARILRANGGHLDPEQQAKLRGARVLLAEYGRTT